MLSIPDAINSRYVITIGLFIENKNFILKIEIPKYASINADKTISLNEKPLSMGALEYSMKAKNINRPNKLIFDSNL